MKSFKFYLIFLALLSLIGILGCDELIKNNPSEILSEKIKTELSKGERNDTIFLGFWFGMSKGQVKSHIQKLLKEEKIYLNDENHYEYVFDFGEDSWPPKGYANFGGEYFNDGLYKFTLLTEYRTSISSSDRLLQMKLVMLYSEKYGYNAIEMEGLIDDTHDYIWIDGNRKIEISVGFGDVKIIYTDLFAEIEKKQKDKIEAKQSKEQIKDDI